MLDIFSITVPIFGIIFLGFLSVRLQVFGKADIRTLGSFVLAFALPALILRSFSQRSFAEIFDPDYVIVYALGSLTVFLIGLFIARLVLRLPMPASALSAMGMSASNSGFIGYPLAALVIGPTAAIALALNMLVENILIIPLALALLEGGGSGGKSMRAILTNTAARLVRTPMIVAIFAGALLSLLEWKLPLPIMRMVDMLAVASGPVALFAIGGMLHGLRLGGMAGNLGLIVAGKLILHPMAVILASRVFPIGNRQLATAAVLMASVPMISIYPIIGQRFGEEKLCAAALLCATALSFITLNVVIWLH